MSNAEMIETRLAESFRRDVLRGLAREHKAIPSRWLYDERGSALFEAITRIDEYYPTRTEIGILTSRANELAHFVGPSAVVIEYGAGAAFKTEILLDALSAPRLYLGIDIAASFLAQTAERLRLRYPEMRVDSLVADFTKRVDLPAEVPAQRRVGFFPGSTIGNLDDRESAAFLSAMYKHVGHGGAALVGIDLIKALDVLLPAYDDAEGVTAEFNRNLLVRINRELGGTFDVESFRHEARWNERVSAVEMHLVSTREQSVLVGANTFAFAKGETIHSESSRKYTVADFSESIARAGWCAEQIWTDERQHYAIIGMRAS